LDYLDRACALAQSRGLRRHLDGARLFNAVIATGKSAARICQGFDSVSVCFSKGLGAPIGSVLCGNAEFIRQAQRWRKILGGGWRQAGLLAAACNHALDHHVERLADDHVRAARLGRELEARGLQVQQHTNMVFVQLDADLATRLRSAFDEAAILASIPASGVLRLVTHLDIDDNALDRVLMAVASAHAARGSAT
jgi:threonine aldolase